MNLKLVTGIAFVALMTVLAGCGGGGSGGSGTSYSSGLAGAYDLNFMGVSFDVHNGQDLNFALARVSDGIDVSDGSVVVISGVFSVTMTDVLESGVSYRLYYYADVNANGMCDAPPTDHAWSNLITSPMADVTISITHDTNFDPNACAYLNNV